MPPPPIPGVPNLAGNDAAEREKNRKATSLKITWGEVTPVDSYQIQIKVGTNTTLVDANAPPTLLQNRPDNSKHVIRVRAKKGTQFSNFSDAFSVFTRPKTPDPPRLVGTLATDDDPLADVTARDANSLQLTWPSVGTGITYDLDFGGGDVRNGVSPDDTFDKLEPNKLYNVRVRARDDVRGGVSDFSSPLRKIRTRPPVPTGLRRLGIDLFFQMMQFHWDSVSAFPGSTPAKWQLGLRVAGTNTDPQIQATGGLGITSFLESHYPLGTQQEYLIRIVAGTNQQNQSFWSPALLVNGPVVNLLGIQRTLNVIPDVGAAVPSLLDQSDPFRL
ncbi:MAG: fibronectin type III domain-containing protein [Planctomycetaceae bacterium]|nr:fibronectin type III domain-containing protein [Planctomycetaceae bacterium]